MQPLTPAYFIKPPLLKAYEQILSNKLGTVIDGENVSWGGSYHDWVRRLLIEGQDPAKVKFISPEEGMENSYQEIIKIVSLLKEDYRGEILYGAPQFLESLEKPIRSDSVDHLIERALADDERPLYIVALAALTNIASAIMLEPKIKEKIVVVWTAAYPSRSPLSNRASMNLVQDTLASQFLFDCGVPHVYLPGFYIGAQLSLSLPDVELWVKGKGEIGDYLYDLYINNPIYAQRGIREHFGRTWIAWDLINIAWLLNPEWVPTQLFQSPKLDDKLCWVHESNQHLMREAVGINRDAIFRDFFRKLNIASQGENNVY